MQFIFTSFGSSSPSLLFNHAADCGGGRNRRNLKRCHGKYFGSSFGRRKIQSMVKWIQFNCYAHTKTHMPPTDTRAVVIHNSVFRLWIHHLQSMRKIYKLILYNGNIHKWFPALRAQHVLFIDDSHFCKLNGNSSSLLFPFPDSTSASEAIETRRVNPAQPSASNSSEDR